MDIRIGHGYDVHRFSGGRKLILGGVEISHPKGLEGHSDADVLAHAVMDSLLGALGLGDIGRHFPDTDPAYKNANSFQLLAQCVEMMGEMGYRLGNLDGTIIAQNPKLAPFIPEMVSNFAKVLGCTKDKVNLKATTEEGMGFTGKGLAVSAHSVCLLLKD